MKYFFLLVVVFFTCQCSNAQDVYTEHTLTAGTNYKSCACKIEQLSWMAGNWQDAGDSVVSEEQWAKPIAGTMMGMYRMVVKGKPLFYELMLLMEHSTGVKLQLKHFSHPLRG